MTKQLYTVLVHYSVYNTSKVKKALYDVKHKTYITDTYAYISNVPQNEKDKLTESLKKCNNEVNGRNYKVSVQYFKYIDVTPKKQKNKKQSNNNKTVAAEAKKRRKQTLADNFKNRKKHVRKTTGQHPRGHNNAQQTTVEKNRVQRAKIVGRSLIKKMDQKPNRTQKKRQKSNSTEQTLKFAA